MNAFCIFSELVVRLLINELSALQTEALEKRFRELFCLLLKD